MFFQVKQSVKITASFELSKTHFFLKIEKEPQQNSIYHSKTNHWIHP